MPYPWPSFGSFIFRRDESPMFGTDLGWQRSHSFAREQVIGGKSDSVVHMSAGSPERTFECWLSPDRLAEFEAQVGTRKTFTDWQRPEPDSRPAVLSEVRRQDEGAVRCSDGETRRKIRIRVRMVGVS